MSLCFFYAFLYYFKCKSDPFIHILLNMKTHFEFDPTNMVVKKYLEKKVQNTFREFKADLHKEYCEFDDLIEARANPPNRITHENWNFMCDR